jgi:L-rhamnose mutarotase
MVWPEMVEQIRSGGIRNYSIYRSGLTLFAYLERDDTVPSSDEPGPVTWRWWKMMDLRTATLSSFAANTRQNPTKPWHDARKSAQPPPFGRGWAEF